jgi:hypothetical protein
MGEKRGVIPNCEDDDIFISYTHVDNDKYARDHQGWVDYMHERLESRLIRYLGEKPTIWRDPKLNGNDYITDTLILKLKKIAILVSVLSPLYVNSKWCRKELAEFYATIGESNTRRFHDKAPIFKVVKTPVNENQCPDELRELLGYEFYEEDPFGGRPNEFSHEITSPTFWKFVQRVDDLAWDMKRFIDSLQETPSGRLVPPTGKTVYLAITSADLNEDRHKIKRELQDFGHRVLPERDFPSQPANLREAITEDLNKSDFSIHMIGKDYDKSEESRRSLVLLQHELALERGRESKFAEVIWIPRGSKLDDDQQRLIEALHHDANTYPGIEVLQNMLEDLKTYIQVKLKNLDTSPDVTPYSETKPVYVYLINDTEDYEATAQLRNFMYDQGIEVLQIGAQEAASEEQQTETIMKLRKDYLNDCDAAIVFQGQAKDNWRDTKLRELRKSHVGRPSEMLGKGIYFPLTKANTVFRSIEFTVMREQDEFPPKDLVSFLAQVRATASARNLQAQGVVR